jgi:hypothetical protein
MSGDDGAVAGVNFFLLNVSPFVEDQNDRNI